MNEKDFFLQFLYDPEKDLLGSGGFGSVYRAYDKREKRYVAIKISQVKDVFGKFTLLNEVELSRSIDDHTNVARYEFGLRVMYPFPVDYAVMAYYEEGNLDMLLRKRNGQFNQKEYFEITEGILEGIKHLHNENIIHRDLKLANILMHRTKQGQWRPKIADFGLSRLISDFNASVSNSAIGITIAYASPEQIENKSIKKNVDLWAFGVILYRLISGDLPFAAPKGADSTSANLEISRKIVQVEIPLDSEQIPEPYQYIIRRCLVKDTAKRAQSADELLDILKGKVIPPKFEKATEQVDDTVIQPISIKTDPISEQTIVDAHIEPVDVETLIYPSVLSEKSREIPQKNNLKMYIIAACSAVVLLVLFFMMNKPPDSNKIEKTTINLENDAYKQALSAGTIPVLKSYLNQYPNGQNTEGVKDSLKVLEEKFNGWLNDFNMVLEDKDYKTAKEIQQKLIKTNPTDSNVIRISNLLKNK